MYSSNVTEETNTEQIHHQYKRGLIDKQKLIELLSSIIENPNDDNHD